MDLQKAYDSIEWGFVDQMLVALRFPEKFRRLLMLCVTTPSFSLCLNGAQFGYLKGKRGLRQGDPMSPLLFTVCMEYLTRVMECATQKWYFRYHPMYGGLKLTHLLFVDDLLMFCKGDVQSIMLLLRGFSTFSAASGLTANAAKSEVIFNMVQETVRNDIVQISGFKQGELLVKYLGVPIQASIFLIPKQVIKRIEAACRNYLWDGGSEYTRTPLVAWDMVCCSKKCGGLGIKQVGVWNLAIVGKLVHWVFTKADRLWIQWVDHIYLKGQQWTDYSPPWILIGIGGMFVRLRRFFRLVALTYGVPHQGVTPSGWLIKLEALNTREKLFRIGISDTDSCVLCDDDKESHKHLFTECAFSCQKTDSCSCSEVAIPAIIV
ncbi:uncharacterized protein LOC141617156 [Silene latifolia]|uniref:uncharacterized protein LOC141617156 n=1 Tax=Silene latifolia TaxID=37657 RepID=UPI003D78A72B